MAHPRGQPVVQGFLLLQPCLRLLDRGPDALERLSVLKLRETSLKVHDLPRLGIESLEEGLRHHRRVEGPQSDLLPLVDGLNKELLDPSPYGVGVIVQVVEQLAAEFQRSGRGRQPVHGESVRLEDRLDAVRYLGVERFRREGV